MRKKERKKEKTAIFQRKSRFSWMLSLVFFALIPLFNSCSKSEQISEKQSTFNIQIDDKIVTFSKALAVALERQDIRDLLKQNTLYEYFDEPYVIFANIANKPLGAGEIHKRANGNTLIEVLNNIVGLDQNNTTYFDEAFIEENPMLTMYIIPSGDDDSYSPDSRNTSINDAIVMIDPFGDDAFQKAYDSELIEYLVSEENLESLNKTAILVYNNAELVAVKLDDETIVGSGTILDLLVGRGVRCADFPEGLEELCESFRTQLAAMAADAPTYLNENFDAYILALERILALYHEYCCSDEGGTGNETQYISCLEDSDNGYCRDTRNFSEEITRIRIPNNIRRDFARFKKVFRIRVRPIHRVLNNIGEPTLSQAHPWVLTLDRSKHSTLEIFDLIDNNKILKGIRWDYCRMAENIEYFFEGIHKDAGTVQTYTTTHNSGKIEARIPVTGGGGTGGGQGGGGATVGVTFPTSTETFQVQRTIRDVELGSTNVLYSDVCGDSPTNRGRQYNTGTIWFWVREGWTN